jgi:hypothetical protein
MFMPEKCRSLAEECEQDAARADCPKRREDMLMVARVWRELAEDQERKLRSGKAA